MAVRAKFRVDHIDQYGPQFNDQATVVASATNVKDGDNKDWSKWSPSGQLTLSITNPDAAKFFRPGQVLWVDFSEVEAEALPAEAPKP
jgi:hypothetical protein